MKGVALWNWVPSNPALAHQVRLVSNLTPGPARTAAMRKLCVLASENAGMVGLVTRPEYVAYRNDHLSGVTLLPIETAGQALLYLDRIHVH
jgi:hypothetical protein